MGVASWAHAYTEDQQAVQHVLLDAWEGIGVWNALMYIHPPSRLHRTVRALHRSPQ